MKKLLSLILSIILLTGTLGGAVFAQDINTDGISVYVTVSRYGEFVTDKNGEAVAMVPVSLQSQELYTLDDVFAEVHNVLYPEGSEGYETAEGDYGLYVTRFWGDTSGNFTYQVNFGAEEVWGPTHQVEDGDYAEFCINKSFYPDTELYTRFDKPNAEACVSETLELRLEQGEFTAEGMSFFPCSDAAVTINGEETQIITDTDGNAELVFDGVGRYIVSARKTKPLEEETVPAIAAPICEVIVGERPEIQVMHNIAEKYSGDTLLNDGNICWFVADIADYMTAFPESGYAFTDEQRQKLVDKIIDFADKSSSQGDLAKAIISLRALGYDAAKTYTKKGTHLDIAAKLTALITEESVLAPYYEYTLPYVMIALEQGDYATEEVTAFLVDFALESQGKWQDTTFGVDGVTPMLRALAPFCEENDAVRAAVDNGVAAVTEFQAEDGSVGNAASTGLAIAGFSAVGIAPESVVKNEKNLIDGLVKEVNGSLDGFLPENNSFATEQGFRGLVAAELYKLDRAVYEFKDFPMETARATVEVKPPVVSGGSSGGGGSSAKKDKVEKKEPEEQAQNEAEKEETKKEQSTETTQIGLPHKNPEVLKAAVVYPDKSFADVENHKNITAIKELAARGIVNGTDNKHYCPDNTMTRAEFAAIVVKALGVPQKGDDMFKDVADNEWFNPYVNTAYHYGIVNGVSESLFNPQGKVTREEAAVIVSRAAKLCGMENEIDEDGTRNILAEFVDYTTSSDWAKESLAFCYREEILDRMETDIKPIAEITRAEVAQMIYNMLGKAKLL